MTLHTVGRLTKHMLMFPFLYLQGKYKEVIGQGTPIPDLPEVKRVKQTQKHISSVMAPPRAGPFLHHPFLLLPAWTTLPALRRAVQFAKSREGNSVFT